ncbi:hypothetical protein [Methanobrevibacter sp.]
MTEKRFCFVYSDGVKYLKDNGKVMPDNIALDLLNKLNDENEQLKQTIQLIIDTAEQNGVITKSELREIKKEILE